MNSTKQNKQKKNPKLWIPSVLLLCLFLAIIGATTFDSLRRYPLGNNTEYLGKKSSGDRLPFFQWSSPVDTYYYGTNMSADELATYFNASIDSVTGDPNDNANYTLKLSNDKKVPVQFYKNKNATFSSPPTQVKNTTKKYFFSVIDDYYEDLKQVTAN